MTRWSAVALLTALALALLTCLGCDSPPEASAESESTRAHMSERNDAQCASALEGCRSGCLGGEQKTQAASHEGEGCPKSDCTCPHAAKEECPKACAATTGEHVSARYPGCPRTDASHSGHESEAQ